MDWVNFWEKLAEYKYPAKSGLDFHNEFTFLVAIVLSAQARDEFINTQTRDLFKIADSAEKMLDLGLEKLIEHIQKIGLWRSKSKYIYEFSKKIVELKKIKNLGREKNWYNSFFETDFNQNDSTDFKLLNNFTSDDLELYADFTISEEGIPTFRAGLLQLAGVGRKSANVFLNIIYQAPVFPVDTHVLRVANRIGCAVGKNPYEVEKTMEETVPTKFAKVASCWLVWHGRKVCTALKPKCDQCLVREYCNFIKNKSDK